MIDYFALLDQPRAPWLDLDDLKNAYHQKTLRAHPDTQTSGKQTGARLADLNEAYQVWTRIQATLQHLLTLEGIPTSPDASVPKDLYDLFPVIGAATQRANLLSREGSGNLNKLSRSLLKSEILRVKNETNEVRKGIQKLLDAALDQMRQINTAWASNPAEQISALSNLYLAFSYLTRWATQLDESIPIVASLIESGGIEPRVMRITRMNQRRITMKRVALYIRLIHTSRLRRPPFADAAGICLPSAQPQEVRSRAGRSSFSIALGEADPPWRAQVERDLRARC